VRPANNVALHPGGSEIALVWDAPREPRALLPTRTYIEVVKRSGSGQRTVFSGFVAATATCVTVPSGEGIYAWRALTVSRRRSLYVASDWARFSAVVAVPFGSSRVPHAIRRG
jgi:hypothetical protein